MGFTGVDDAPLVDRAWGWRWVCTGKVVSEGGAGVSPRDGTSAATGGHHNAGGMSGDAEGRGAGGATGAAVSEADAVITFACLCSGILPPPARGSLPVY